MMDEIIEAHREQEVDQLRQVELQRYERIEKKVLEIVLQNQWLTREGDSY